jgi:hypothetical protein
VKAPESKSSFPQLASKAAVVSPQPQDHPDAQHALRQVAAAVNNPFIAITEQYPIAGGIP